MSDVRYPAINPSNICHKCQSALSGTERFCPGCGAPVPVPPKPSASDSTGDQTGTKTSDVPHPPLASDKVSSLIAAAVATEKLACPQCHQMLPLETLFCFHCGQRLSPPEKSFYLCRVGNDGSVEIHTKVEKEMIIGKAPECGLVMAQDPYVSRQHARISLVDGRLQLEDLGSANGTFLRIHRAIQLEPGDELVIGSGTLRVEYHG